MSVLEIWGAEYQENDCILIKPEDRGVLEAVCKRERCLMQVRRANNRPAWHACLRDPGAVRTDRILRQWRGRKLCSVSKAPSVISNALPAQVLGSIDGSGRIRLVDPQAPPGTPTPVDLELETVLGSMPNKTFRFSRTPLESQPLNLPEVIDAHKTSLAEPCG
jgi:phosphoribosylformylglycinamidine synthase